MSLSPHISSGVLLKVVVVFVRSGPVRSFAAWLTLPFATVRIFAVKVSVVVLLAKGPVFLIVKFIWTSPVLTVNHQVFFSLQSVTLVIFT